MTVTDDTIRQAVRDAIPATHPAGIAELESSIEARIVRRRRRRVATLGTVAALLVVLLGSAVLVASGRDDTHEEVVAGPPGTSTTIDDTGFSDLGPGWHELDPGPVPPSDQTSTAWTGTELIVVAGLQTFAYDPTTQHWRTLGILPFEIGDRGDVIWTGGVLVAVGSGTSPRADAAVLDPAKDTSWTPIDGPETAPDLLAAGAMGPGSTGGALVWTGQRLVDAAHGAVLDPDGWTWSPLPFPPDLVTFSHLLYANPVWDGTEVVLAAATTAPGLAWDATGTTYREISGIPADLLPSTGQVFPAVATSDGPRSVVVVASAGLSGVDDTNAWQLDSASSTWTKLPSAPGLPQMEGCPGAAATVDGHVLVAGCTENGDIYELGDDAWSATNQTTGLPWTSAGTWLDAGGALVIWEGNTDPTNLPAPPFVGAWVWIPAGS